MEQNPQPTRPSRSEHPEASDIVDPCSSLGAFRPHAEEARVSVRNIRRDANETFKKGQKDGSVSEDDSRRAVEKVQEVTDKHITDIDEVLKVKEAEIMEV